MYIHCNTHTQTHTHTTLVYYYAYKNLFIFLLPTGLFDSRYQIENPPAFTSTI